MCCIFILGYGRVVFTPDRLSDRLRSPEGGSCTELWMCVSSVVPCLGADMSKHAAQPDRHHSTATGCSVTTTHLRMSAAFPRAQGSGAAVAMASIYEQTLQLHSTCLML